MIAIEDTYFTMAAKSEQVIDKVLDYQCIEEGKTTK